MSAVEANKKADEMGYDLVKISPNAVPPVCRIMDYGKFKFDQMKKLKELKKNQKVTDVKEIQLSMTIEKHDIEVKAKHATKFLENGDKVKVSIRMKGRQQARPEMGVEIMNNFAQILEAVGVVEKKPEILGKNIFMIMVPVKK